MLKTTITTAAIRITIVAPQFALTCLYWPPHPASQSTLNPIPQSTDSSNMQKCAIFILLAAIFGGLGFGFARFCPIAAPKSVSVKDALALNSANAVLTLREHKFVELGKLLAQM